MRRIAVAVLAMGLPVVYAQAPVVRRPPAVQGAQAPVSDDDAAGGPQPQKGGVPTIRVETRLVNVAVNVADTTGAPVGGLGKGDFELLEDGKPLPIAVFERDTTTPLSIVLAIDTSETVLTSERLEKESAKRFVDDVVREQDELDLLEFSDVVRELVPFTNQKKQIEHGINDITRGDATALYDAIYLASKQLQGTSPANGRRRVVVLITDGGDTVKGSRYTQALEQAQRAGAMVYSIIMVPIMADAGRNTGGEHALIQMAEDTGGKYYYVEDPKKLDEAFAHLSDDLRTQYLLGYYAPRRNADTSFRAIKVRMVDAGLREKYQLRYRTGYFADGR